MNKEDFIKKLSEKTGISIEQCGIVNEILEKIPLIGEENKDKIINEIKTRLNLPDEAVDGIYNAAAGILAGGIGEKIKSFFKK